MPLYDVRCPEGHEAERWAGFNERTLPCDVCGLPTERIWKAKPSSVISDEWAGGKTFENGFAAPRTFYSPSEYRKALAAEGLAIRGDGEESGAPSITAASLRRAEQLMERVYGSRA